MENLSLYFAAYTGDKQFLSERQYFANGWAEKYPVKMQNPVKRSATPR